MKQNTFLFLLALAIILFGQCITKPTEVYLPIYIDNNGTGTYSEFYVKPIKHGLLEIYNFDYTETSNVLVPEDNWSTEPREYKVFTGDNLEGYLYETEIGSNYFYYEPYE